MVDPAVLRMLTAVEEMAGKNGLRRINDAIFTLALMEETDDVRSLLEVWVTEEGMRKFLARLRAGALPAALKGDLIFNQQHGELDKNLLHRVAAFCRRLAEDASSLGAKKITTPRHMLYTLLGNDSGLLTLALTVRGVNVKRDLHATLSRELVQAGKKRNDQFALTRDTVFGAVEQVFLQSCAECAAAGADALQSVTSAANSCTSRARSCRDCTSWNDGSI